jgi:SynChlorMet cassette radical SAM/SPASM protein ScmF
MHNKDPEKRKSASNVGESFPLTHIYFYITNDCNLRCRHCWISPLDGAANQPRAALAGTFFRHILKQARSMGLVGVKLTGGEPLIHPEIHEFLDYLIANEFSAGIETNGTNLTKEIAKKISKIRGPFVAVSLDGENAVTHEAIRRVPGCFKATQNGIRNLVDKGLRPQIIMSLTRHNKEQIEGVVRLAESLGAGSVKFNLVQPTGRGEEMHRNCEALAIRDSVELGRWVENELSSTTQLQLTFSHPVVFKPLSRIFCSATGCDVCRIHNILGVLSDGSFSLCGIGEHLPDLVFGHAGTDTLRDVWNHSEVLKELRRGLPGRLQGVCGDCLMKKVCRGNCIAQNYYRTHNLWAPFWYCEEAEKMGLFPVNRSIAKLSAGA